MTSPSQSTEKSSLSVQQQEAANTSFSFLSLREIIPENAKILRREGTMKTKPCIFDDPQILSRMAMVFCMGGTVEEAANFAGCSVSVIKKHMRERTPFQVTTRYGEVCVQTFDEMINGWRVQITMLAKIAIYKSLFSPDLKFAAKNAWKILERQEPNEQSNVCRECRRRGVKVY